MSQIRKLQERKKRREQRVRSKLKKTMPRLVIFRSLKQIYAQIINDSASKTMVSCSSLELGNQVSGDKTAVALAVGKELGERAKKEGISQVQFDRGPYLFHGRVKAVADGVLESGIKI